MTFHIDRESTNILIYLMLLNFFKSITVDFIDDIHITVPFKKDLIIPVTYHGTIGLLDNR